MVLGARRALTDPVTGLLWRFPTHYDAHAAAPPDLTVYNGWEKVGGGIVISTFGA